ncbi:AAWKG family protein [Streptomyces poonensis]|uniref:Microtubule/TRAF3 and DISC1 binding protein n=1 Tax=Streptomyces poonensis TaxID=68255 RepID=A0A918PE00_9ACTN|nr:AAWKG family protein [Streptomyces poonensis]GGZ00869.1 hypothetical protein GCM10010365_19630 [Streptomyces poonensis]GLJ90423.1 hypothetical protein GCM10017589_30260 [Streptomyces poonensis]
MADDSVIPLTGANDSWHKAVKLFTGYDAPTRDTLFKTLIGNEGIPQMKVEITRQGKVTYVDVNDLDWMVENSGWRIENTDFVIPFYATGDGTAESGDQVSMYKARFTLLGNKSNDGPPVGGVVEGGEFKSQYDNHLGLSGDKATWSTQPLTQYAYGTGRALEALLYKDEGTHDFSWNGKPVNNDQAVTLTSFDTAAAAFDRTAQFFVDRAAVIEEWESRVGREENKAWRGQAAGVFWNLIHTLGKQYDGYAKDMRPEGTTGSLQGNEIRQAKQDFRDAVAELHRHWMHWELYMGNPLRWLHDLLKEIADHVWHHNIRQITYKVNTVGTGYGGYSTYTTYHTTGAFSQTATRLGKQDGFGPLTELSTWKKVGERAIENWQASVIENLVNPADEALRTVHNSWSTSGFDLGSIRTRTSDDLKTSYTEDVNEKEKEEAEKAAADAAKAQADFMQWQKDQAAKAEADAKKAKEEAERKEREAKEEAERKEKEAKEEAERKEKEAEAKEAAAKAEAEKKEAEAKAEAERKEAEAKAEAERKEAEAKAEQEAAKAEAEAEQAAAKAEAEQKEAAAKAEAEQKEAEAKAEAEREKAEAKAEQEAAKAEAEAKEAEALARQEQQQAEAEQKQEEYMARQEAMQLLSMNEAKTEQERTRKEQEAAEAEARAEQEAAEAEAEAEEAAAKAEAEQKEAQAKAEAEQKEAEAKAEQEAARKEAEAEEAEALARQEQQQAEAEAKEAEYRAEQEARQEELADRQQAAVAEAESAQQAAIAEQEAALAEQEARLEAQQQEYEAAQQQAEAQYQRTVEGVLNGGDLPSSDLSSSGTTISGPVYDDTVDLSSIGAGDTAIDSRGRVVTDYPDGTTVTVDPVTHSATVTRPDGTAVSGPLNTGDLLTTPDGSVIHLDERGRLVTEYPDGGTSTIDPETGLTTYTAPDGTTTSGYLNGGPGSSYGRHGSTTGYDWPSYEEELYDDTPYEQALAGSSGSGLSATDVSRAAALNGTIPLNTGTLPGSSITDDSASGTGTGTGTGGMPFGGMPMGGMGGMGAGGQGGQSSERVRNVIDSGQVVSSRGARTGASGTRAANRHTEEADIALPRATATTTGGMPFMPPMGGAGGPGQTQTQSGDRVRDAWVQEEEDVWGTDEGGAPAVIGR